MGRRTMQTLLERGSYFAFRKGFFYLLRWSCFHSLLTTLIFSSFLSRTWYIKVDGSGDAPTIKAGVDSSTAGDTVFVAAGIYELEQFIILKQGIVLKSENGVSFVSFLTLLMRRRGISSKSCIHHLQHIEPSNRHI